MSILEPNNDAPLYEQLMVKIKEEIVASKSRAGGRLLSQKAMAQKYDVSLITVKRAMRELAVQGIIVGHARRGTYVARKKTTFAIPEQNVIGFAMIDPPDSQTGLLIRGAEEYAVKKGYRLLIAPALFSPKMESEQIDFFHSMGVAGILAGGIRRDYVISDSLARLHKVGFPYVLLSYAADPQIKQVCIDDEEAGYVAAAHLIKSGRHTIAFLGAEPDSPTGELKKKGYLRALRKHKLTVSAEFEFHVRQAGAEQEYAAGYKIGQQCIRTQKIPEGVVACSDHAALGFEQAMLDHDVLMPAETAVVGFGNMDEGLQAPLPLTTLRHPMQQIGASAMEKLIKQIEGKKVKGRTTLRVSLVVRESCGVKDRTRYEAAMLDGLASKNSKR